MITAAFVLSTIMTGIMAARTQSAAIVGARKVAIAEGVLLCVSAFITYALTTVLP